MASTSGSALQEILEDKELFASHFGFSHNLFDSDESDIDVELDDDECEGKTE